MSDRQFKYSTCLFSPERGGVYAGFPFDGQKEFGKRGPIRVNCTIDGFRMECSLLPMGDGTHAIYVRKEVQKIIGKKVGDKVEMSIQQNLLPRNAVIPEDIQWLLDDDPELKRKFDDLTIYNKEAIVAYIDQAKHPETRARRIDQMLERVRMRRLRE